MAMGGGSPLRVSALVPAICLIVVFGSGCADEAGRERARLFAVEFLSDVSGGRPDYGWSLLHPDIRRDAFNGDYESYSIVVEAAEWSTFRWEVVDVVADDPSLHFVTLRLPAGAESVPAFLQDHRGWSIIALGSDPTLAVMSVRLGVPVGPSGVWAAGG
jgi:hypothetical protein